VRRVGLALVEGGGRRLRFLSAARDEMAETWCHIDAYDDVPLTHVVRSGGPVIGGLDDLDGRFAGLVAAQREQGVRALAAIPLPGASGPVGGLILYYDRPQDFGPAQRGALSAAARRVADAVRRVRARRSAVRPGPGRHGSAGGTRTAWLLLEDDPRAVAVARQFLRETLAAWEIEGEPVHTAELCLSELVTNAVIHAGSTSELTLRMEDALLTVAVRDHGGPPATAPEVVDDEDPMRVFGRGLVLVDALSDRWGSEQDAVGTTSWFTLAVSREAVTAPLPR
jgi:anti-sigma regulatory factor (Ser/Thr protein kinase)